MKKDINIFFRQPFTETSEYEEKIIGDAFEVIKSIQQEGVNFKIVTGEKALNRENFKSEWEKLTGHIFSPPAFRDYRISLLNKSDVFINIRTGMSESSAFEMAYNVYNNKIPMFIAIWDKAPIKTTMLRDLDDLCYVEYFSFSDPEELYLPVKKFIQKVANSLLHENNLINAIS